MSAAVLARPLRAARQKQGRLLTRRAISLVKHFETNSGKDVPLGSIESETNAR
jgi:hypothetical protein